MVASLDGFIAKKNGDVSWLQSSDSYDKGVTLTAEDIEEYLKRIDCYVMGSNTYEHALKLGWPYGDVPVYVFTKREMYSEKKSVSFISGDTESQIKKIQSRHQNIWMVGGAELTKEFIGKKLADDIIISVMPVLLGDGILFFDFVGLEQKLHLKDVTAYKDGMVEMWYEIVKDVMNKDPE